MPKTGVLSYLLAFFLDTELFLNFEFFIRKTRYCLEPLTSCQYAMFRFHRNSQPKVYKGVHFWRRCTAYSQKIYFQKVSIMERYSLAASSNCESLICSFSRCTTARSPGPMITGTSPCCTSMLPSVEPAKISGI